MYTLVCLDSQRMLLDLVNIHLLESMSKAYRVLSGRSPRSLSELSRGAMSLSN